MLRTPAYRSAAAARAGSSIPWPMCVHTPIESRKSRLLAELTPSADAGATRNQNINIAVQNAVIFAAIERTGRLLILTLRANPLPAGLPGDSRRVEHACRPSNARARGLA